MPRECSVCTAPDREAIDRAVVERTGSFRNIAKRFGVSASALHRHRKAHLPETLAKARAAEEIAEADDLLDQLQSLQRRALGVLAAAEESKDHHAALRAIGEARRNIELLARLLGELEEAPAVTVVLSAEWLEVRAVVLRALDRFPDARLAVAEALDASD